MTYDTWQEALAALVKKHGIEDSELGDISRRTGPFEDVCADCGSIMGAWKCPLCGGIRSDARTVGESGA